jgi:hypothetical protein
LPNLPPRGWRIKDNFGSAREEALVGATYRGCTAGSLLFAIVGNSSQRKPEV